MGLVSTRNRMAHANITVEMDHKGRITIREPARKKLGINDMEPGEKQVLDLKVSK